MPLLQAFAQHQTLAVMDLRSEALRAIKEAFDGSGRIAADKWSAFLHAMAKFAGFNAANAEHSSSKRLVYKLGAREDLHCFQVIQVCHEVRHRCLQNACNAVTAHLQLLSEGQNQRDPLRHLSSQVFGDVTFEDAQTRPWSKRYASSSLPGRAPSVRCLELPRLRAVQQADRLPIQKCTGPRKVQAYVPR